MPEDEDRPLRLADLADVQSPDIMRAALSRFRRRTIIRGLAIALVFLALPPLFRGLDPPESTWIEKVARAHTIEIGRVVDADGFRVVVLDARRLRDEDAEKEEEEGFPPPPLFVEGNRVIHVVIVAEGIRMDEQLVVGDPLLFGPTDVERDPRRGTRAVEAFLPYAQGQRRIGVPLYALTGAEVGTGERGPGLHTQQECAIPLNPLGVCELLKGEGRSIGSVTLDLTDLGVPDRVGGA